MGTVCTIGLDIAKNIFQVHGEDKHGKAVLVKKLRRDQVVPFFAHLPQCLIGIESCGSSHYWGRTLEELGHDVKLIPPRQVKPFVINNKTDAADARAICEVVKRSSTRFVRIKNLDQQKLSSLHCIRERRVHERTALINQIRSLLAELGIVMPQGANKFVQQFPILLDLENDVIPIAFKQMFRSLYDEFTQLQRNVENIEEQIREMAQANQHCKQLMKIPGIGVFSATALVAHFGDAKQFKNGRQFAACLGLTPREYSSGGKQKLGGISKRGNKYIRKLLIQGAVSVCRIWVMKQAEEHEIRKKWLQELVERRGKFIATVAQANKTARIVWNVLAKNEDYRQEIKAA